MSLESRDSDRFVGSVVSRLENQDFVGAGEILKDDRHSKFLKNNCWELVPLLCKKLKDEDSYLGSKELLEFLAGKVDPDEAVLEFLEQLDEVKEIRGFSVLLTLLKTLLFRLDGSNRRNPLEWCLNSARSILEQISCTEEGDSSSESSCQDDLIKSLLEIFFCFIEAFISEVEDDSDKNTIKPLLSSRLLQSCDILLFIIDVEGFEEIRCHVRNLTLKLMPDPYVLLEHILCRSTRTKLKIGKKETIGAKKTDDLRELAPDKDLENLETPVSVFEDEFVISNLSYGAFFYFFLTDKMEAPLVYSPKYLFLSLIHAAVPFFEKPIDRTVEKGLAFLESLLEKLEERQLEKCDLCFETHLKLLVALKRTMVFSEAKGNRTLALKCFRKYILSFNWEARYWLLFNFRKHVRHPGTLGYLVIVLKEFLSDFLNLPASSETFKQFSKYYRGKLLFDLILKYCLLPEDGAFSTDLVEHADHVISSLNLIRFLLLKDGEKNVTAVKFFIEKIGIDFLKPLGEFISRSRKDWDVRLEDLKKEEKETGVESSSSVVQVQVKHSPLPELTKEQQKGTVLASLNAIDLVDSLFCRVSEIIYETYSYRL